MIRLGLPVAATRPLAGVVGRWTLGPSVDVLTARSRLERCSLLLGAGRGVRVTSTTLGGVPCERLDVGAGGGTHLLYLHGGAYLVGSPRTHRGLAAGLARRLGATAWVLDYRLAPEHRFPAALDDARAAYRSLVERHPAGRVVIAGESAGGGMTLALAMTLRDAGEPPPAALGLMSPWLDPATDFHGGRRPVPREPLLDPSVLVRGARAYAEGADVADPRISPLRGELGGLPPIVVSSGTDDLLFPDAEELERCAADAGAAVVHQRHDGVWHGFQAFAPVMPAAATALDEFAVVLGAAACAARGGADITGAVLSVDGGTSPY